MPDYPEIRDSNRHVYDSLAAQYEAKAWARIPSAVRRARFLAGLVPPESRVLDVGCGVGLTMAEFDRLGFDVTGLDLSPQMARLTQARNPTCQVLIGDFLDLTLPHSYELILAQAFIHLFPVERSAALFQRFRTCVTPGGVLSVCTNVSVSSAQGWSVKDDYHLPTPRFKKFWRREEVWAALTDNGFTVIDERQTVDIRGKHFLEVCARRDRLTG
ncbi:class I SAM-dependent methyltransferase [Micromonospora sp. NPDC049301]|uniref:class I SAM-dependent methyltransferase n=1 Tax=Micromonospora sp. NPDC049301 TaxID=3155723 RepID=UPI0034175DCF